MVDGREESAAVHRRKERSGHGAEWETEEMAEFTELIFTVVVSAGKVSVAGLNPSTGTSFKSFFSHWPCLQWNSSINVLCRCAELSSGGGFCGKTRDESAF